MTLKRMDNVGIVVEDLDAAIRFFIELGPTLEGCMPVEGEWAGRLVATVVDEVINYQDLYRLCYVHGPEGILITLAQELCR